MGRHCLPDLHNTDRTKKCFKVFISFCQLLHLITLHAPTVVVEVVQNCPLPVYWGSNNLKQSSVVSTVRSTCSKSSEVGSFWSSIGFVRPYPTAVTVVPGVANPTPFAAGCSKVVIVTRGSVKSIFFLNLRRAISFSYRYAKKQLF